MAIEVGKPGYDSGKVDPVANIDVLQRMEFVMINSKVIKRSRENRD